MRSKFIILTMLLLLVPVGMKAQAPDLSGDFKPNTISKLLMPRVFSGYRHLKTQRFTTDLTAPELVEQVWRDSLNAAEPEELTPSDSLLIMLGFKEAPAEIPSREELTVAFGSATPAWLQEAIYKNRSESDFVYGEMIHNPALIQHSYWELPEPPRLTPEDRSMRGFLKHLALPELEARTSVESGVEIKPIHWLHTFNIALQLSQAYVSGNWYQGGNSYLAFLGNFLWDVQLNNVYYPKLIFQSTVSYKLAINSTPDDEYHKYSVSQDLFQYNLKAGYKAIKHWYYSFLMQFKTQFFNSYPSNSPTRSASFLSPGDLNLGLGMTYSKENAKKTLKFSASVSPLSYNLKTCIDSKVDHAQFNIKPDRKWVNEYGSNAEINFYAKIWDNTTYTTRLFLFSDYSMFLGDWENTFNFQFSRLFSTQLYFHLRYDTSADPNIDRKWRKLMMKEILSVGISYTFSTK